MRSWVARSGPFVSRSHASALLLVSALLLFALSDGAHLGQPRVTIHGRMAAVAGQAPSTQLRVGVPAHHHQASPRSALRDSPVMPARDAALRTPPVASRLAATEKSGPQVAAGPPYLARGP